MAKKTCPYCGSEYCSLSLADFSKQAEVRRLKKINPKTVKTNGRM